MDKTSILKIIKNVKDKLQKMKKQSEDIFSSQDENNFFQQFLNFCTSKEAIDKNYAQKTFFDKIKDWYKRYLGENRNINLDEFKFINEEAKILTESICEKQNLIQIKNIFNAWKKGFSYNYKNKFNFDVDYIESELNNIIKILNKLDIKDFSSDLGLEPEQKITQAIKRSLPKEKIIEPKKAETPSVFIPASKITSMPVTKIETPSSSEKPPEEITKPVSEKPKETSLPVDVEENTAIIISSLKELGIDVNEKMEQNIRKLVASNNIDHIIDLYNTGDAKAIKYILS